LLPEQASTRLGSNELLGAQRPFYALIKRQNPAEHRNRHGSDVQRSDDPFPNKLHLAARQDSSWESRSRSLCNSRYCRTIRAEDVLLIAFICCLGFSILGSARLTTRFVLMTESPSDVHSCCPNFRAFNIFSHGDKVRWSCGPKPIPCLDLGPKPVGHWSFQGASPNGKPFAAVPEPSTRAIRLSRLAGLGLQPTSLPISEAEWRGACLMVRAGERSGRVMEKSQPGQAYI